MAKLAVKIGEFTEEIGSAPANVKAKADRIRALRAEASRLSSMANKRLQRLEANKLTDAPAYLAYVSDGGHRFGVKGKTYNEVQAELARLHKFLDAKTSTIRGSMQVLKDMAANIGIDYEGMKDLKAKAPKFFEIASKAEQYLRNVDDIATAIGYQKIWEAINTYTEEMGIDLADTDEAVEDMVLKITDAIKEQEAPARSHGAAEWYVIDK